MNDTINTTKGENVVTEKPKTHKNVSLDMLDKLIKAYEITDPQASEELGYSRSTVSVWRKSGRMPLVASLAAEGLIQRQGVADGGLKALKTLKSVKTLLSIVATSADDDVRISLLRTIGELIDKAAPVTRIGS